MVFIPLWILDGFAAIFFAVYPLIATQKLKALASSLQFLCLLVFEILLAIQLQSNNLPWAGVFGPLYAFQALSFFKVALASTPKKFDEQSKIKVIFTFGCGYPGFLFRQFFMPTIISIFLVLVVLRLETVDTWTWWVNAIPLLTAILWKMVIRIMDDVKSLGTSDDAEEKMRKKVVLCGMSVGWAIVLAFVLTFLILAVVKLDGASYSMAIVFIPLYIILGILFCCCCCCSPCIICLGNGPMGDEEDFYGGFDANAPWWEIRRQKYLENGERDYGAKETDVV